MQTSVPAKHVLQILMKPDIPQKGLYALFDYFLMTLVRDLSRSIYLPSLGGKKLRKATDKKDSIKDELDAECNFAGRVQFPNGIFCESIEVSINPQEIHKFYWGATTQNEWELWMMTVRLAHDGCYAIGALRTYRCAFFEDMYECFEQMTGTKPPPLVSMWDALYLEVDTLIRSREHALADAQKSAQIVEIINWSLMAH